MICLTVDVDELPVSTNTFCTGHQNFLQINGVKVLISCDVVIVQEFSNSWGVTATPTFFFLKDGRQIDKLIGSNKLELQRKTAAVSKLLR